MLHGMEAAITRSAKAMMGKGVLVRALVNPSAFDGRFVEPERLRKVDDTISIYTTCYGDVPLMADASIGQGSYRIEHIRIDEV